MACFQGHHRRGAALSALGRHEEALLALCTYVVIDRNPQAVKHELTRVSKRKSQFFFSQFRNDVYVHVCVRGSLTSSNTSFGAPRVFAEVQSMPLLTTAGSKVYVPSVRVYCIRVQCQRPSLSHPPNYVLCTLFERKKKNYENINFEIEK